MHLSYNDILERAVDIGGGYKRVTVMLDDGDTAEDVTSTKYVLAGEGEVEYTIHPSGIHMVVGDGVIRSARPAAR